MKGVKMSSEEFLERIKEIFDDNLFYERVKFIGRYHKVRIECPIHGKFEKIAWHLLKGRGCKKCGYSRCGPKIRSEKNTIKRFKKKYRNKYDYSLCVYVDRKTKMTIICNTCKKIFSQSSQTHTNNKRGGCPFCRKEKIRYMKDFRKNSCNGIPFYW